MFIPMKKKRNGKFAFFMEWGEGGKFSNVRV